MNLVQTVSVILERQVTENEAKEFALNQYGVLATYIRNKYLDSFTKEKKRKRTPKEIIMFGSKSEKYKNNLK